MRAARPQSVRAGPKTRRGPTMPEARLYRKASQKSKRSDQNALCTDSSWNLQQPPPRNKIVKVSHLRTYPDVSPSTSNERRRPGSQPIPQCLSGFTTFWDSVLLYRTAATRYCNTIIVECSTLFPCNSLSLAHQLRKTSFVTITIRNHTICHGIHRLLATNR